MATDLRSKFIDGILSVAIIMAIMVPLILLFRLLKGWGTPSYWVAVVVTLALCTCTLYRATLEKLTDVERAWYGIFSGMIAWTVEELSHEIGMISLEEWDGTLIAVLAVLTLAVLWKHLPVGARFWMMAFMMNWIGHLYLHLAEVFFAGSALKTVFNITAVTCGILITGLVYWIFARTTTRIQRLWGGLWIWIAASMIYFLVR